jgi:hypothetical protein
MAAPPVPEKIRKKVLKRDSFRCVFCNFGTPTDQTILEVAHIKPRAKPGYGGNEEENLISLCPNCHTLMDRLECICIDPETFEIVVKSGFEEFIATFSGPGHRSYLRNRLSIGSLEFRYSMVMG